ncbi:hypothetical protein GGH17_006307, partial [Coemansia sp. RSA 788]
VVEEPEASPLKTIDPSDEGTPSFAAVAASPSPVEAKAEEAEKPEAETDEEEYETEESSDE